MLSRRSNSQTILEVKHLKKFFASKTGMFASTKQFVHAVDDVSFSLRQGETLGIVGESGCGKSTLGKTILRLYEPDSGEIFFEGKNFLTLDPFELRKARKELQIIFQDPYSSLNPRMKIKQILAEPFQIHESLSTKEIYRKVSELLELVGLGQDALNRFPHEFSGGQRQRIGIARAIALRPKVIIADEPVSALDVSIQSQILNLLVDLRDKLQLSYVFIAHDLAVIEHISNIVAVMYLGKIVEMASAEKIYTEPLHPYTKALIAAIPTIDTDKRKKRQIIAGDVPNPIKPPSGCRFHTRCPIATDLCKIESPALKPKDQVHDQHLVACHHA